MCRNPPPQSQHAGWPVAGAKLDKSNNFNHSALPQARISAESGMPELWHSLRQPTYQAV
jgi:hypothetical protein